jgi:hypothetical protein
VGEAVKVGGGKVGVGEGVGVGSGSQAATSHRQRTHNPIQSKRFTSQLYIKNDPPAG